MLKNRGKMTLEKLADMTTREFSAIRKEMVTKDDLKNALTPYATKDDLKNALTPYATKDDLKNALTPYATKDDLKNALTPYATKDDLKQFATKDDLKQFATKDDLKQFATKDDLKQFATKDDLQKSTVDILCAFDKILVRFDKTEKDSAADKLLHDRHEGKLESHEQRLIVLETTTR